MRNTILDGPCSEPLNVAALFHRYYPVLMPPEIPVVLSSLVKGENAYGPSTLMPYGRQRLSKATVLPEQTVKQRRSREGASPNTEIHRPEHFAQCQNIVIGNLAGNERSAVPREVEQGATSP